MSIMPASPAFSATTYQQRRKVLREQIGFGQILILGNGESSRNFKDNWYPFRQDSSFLYYFGIDLPDIMGVIDCENDKDYLIGDDLTIDHIIWTGPQPTMSELGDKVGIDAILPSNKIQTIIGNSTHYLPPYRGEHYRQLSEILSRDIDEIETDASLPLIKAIVEQRNVKSTDEVIELHKATNITSAMHLAVMQSARPDMMEYELVGVAKRIAAEHNVEFSFPPILSKFGQTLHNHYHGNAISEGDMVLYDGGAESHSYYAGDMTRTFPVGKQYTNRQKEIYQIVYDCHRGAVEALAPGKRYMDIHLDVARTMVDGLKALGLMKGDTNEAVQAGAHALFFPHGLGHMIGLDVHDMENLGEVYVGYGDEFEKSTQFGLKSLRLGRTLQEGFALTVEPGIYFIPELIDKFSSEGQFVEYVNYDKLESYKDFGGIRLEEDFVITKDGSELLGTPLASSVEEIEAIRGGI
ncbi:MAG: aminopeptidase P family protein [Bacteroidia bacterium]|nr:aminopeptidase P family protein [Bacteroidia bacterium]